VVIVDPHPKGAGLAGAQTLVVSANGAAVYVAGSGTLASLARDPSTGLLALVDGSTGCFATFAGDNCTVISDLTTPTKLGLGVGGELYAPAVNKIYTFDPSGYGLVRRANAAGCIGSAPATAACASGRGLASAITGLVATGDGQDVYASSSGSGAVVELDRGGSLTARGDTRGCQYNSGTAIATCALISTMVAPQALAVSADGHSVYSAGAGRLSVFKRDSNSPVCENVTINVTSGTAPALKLPCRDEDGDALSYQVITPPTLGSLGALDNGAGTIIYAAPQGQNGTSTFTFRASYSSFATFEAIGSITVNVVGASPSGVDADKDGFFAGQDCNDANAAIRPGAMEVKGNRIDENCDGVAEPFLLIPVGVSHGWDYKKGSVILTLKALAITQGSPAGMKVKIFCKGKKCPFKSKSLKPAKAKKGARSVLASLTKKQRRFRSGQTVEVWVSAPNFNTKVARIPLKKAKAPVATALCVAPGDKTPQKTCN
jgi:hypothetical protein